MIGAEVIRCFVKGAPDQLLDRAAFALDSNLQRVPLDPYTTNIWPTTRAWASRGCV